MPRPWRCSGNGANARRRAALRAWVPQVCAQQPAPIPASRSRRSLNPRCRSSCRRRSAQKGHAASQRKRVSAAVRRCLLGNPGHLAAGITLVDIGSNQHAARGFGAVGAYRPCLHPAIAAWAPLTHVHATCVSDALTCTWVPHIRCPDGRTMSVRQLRSATLRGRCPHLQPLAVVTRTRVLISDEAPAASHRQSVGAYRPQARI